MKCKYKDNYCRKYKMLGLGNHTASVAQWYVTLSQVFEYNKEDDVNFIYLSEQQKYNAN